MSDSHTPDEQVVQQALSLYSDYLDDNGFMPMDAVERICALSFSRWLVKYFEVTQK
jgi:hypothetical protein